MLPILHLNGYKIANPTILARIPHEELQKLLEGYGWTPYLRRRPRAGEDAPGDGGQRWTRSIERRSSRSNATRGAKRDRVTAPAAWPMIVLKSPKGWTGPKVVDGVPNEGTFRAHQVPLVGPGEESRTPASNSRGGCRATSPKSCSTSTGRLNAGTGGAGAPRPRAGWAPIRTPTADCCCATCACRTSASTPCDVPSPGGVQAADTLVSRQVPPRRHQAERGPAELPHLRPRRNAVQPSRRRLRSDQPPVGGRDVSPNDQYLAAHRAGDGGAQRAPVRGVAGRVSADRAGTGCSTATRRSSTSSTRCSTSTPSG